MLKIRRCRDRLIFNMGIPIPGKDGLYIETGPWKSSVAVTVVIGIHTFGAKPSHEPILIIEKFKSKFKKVYRLCRLRAGSHFVHALECSLFSYVDFLVPERHGGVRWEPNELRDRAAKFIRKLAGEENARSY